MDTVIRVAVIYTVLLLVFRVLGKRELAALTPFELVTLMIVPEIVSQSLSDGDHSLTGAIVGVMTLFLLVFATSALTHRFPRLQSIAESPPKMLVADGQILEKNMNEERVSPEELFSEMHRSGIARLADVRWAILQTDGHIAIVPRANVEPAPRTEESPFASG